jgi:hypothetical protein
VGLTIIIDADDFLFEVSSKTDTAINMGVQVPLE